MNKLMTTTLVILLLVSCNKKHYTLDEYDKAFHEIVLLSKNNEMSEAIKKTKVLLTANYMEMRALGFQYELNYELAKLYEKIGDSEKYQEFIDYSIELKYVNAYIEKCDLLLSKKQYSEFLELLKQAFNTLNDNDEWDLQQIAFIEFYIKYYVQIKSYSDVVLHLDNFFDQLQLLLKDKNNREFASITISGYYKAFFENPDAIELFNEYEHYHLIKDKLISNTLLNLPY